MSIEENVEQTSQQVAYFFIDETWLEIEGKRHIMVGALTPFSPAQVAVEMVKVKNELGFAALDEVKMNTKGLTRDLKIKLTDGVLSILWSCTGFVSIIEGNDKQKAAEMVATQLFDYCSQRNIPAYVLYFDNDLVPQKRIFERFVKSNLVTGSNCIGIQHLDSSGEQLIQCCDVFLGLYRLSMEIEFGSRIIMRPVYRESLGVEEEWSLSEYVIISTRGQLWGVRDMQRVYDEPGYEDILYPFHRSMNLGFRINSSVSQETKQLLEDKLATVFMGCMS